MFSDIKLLYLTQDSGYTPSCFTGWFLGKCLCFNISKAKIGNKKYEIGKGYYAPLLYLFLGHYALKKALRKEWKRLKSLNFCPKMMGKAAETTEMPDPKQTRGETWPCHSPASPLKSSWHHPCDPSILLLLLCHFIFNHKQLPEV